jgi:hypothetical protein
MDNGVIVSSHAFDFFWALRSPALDKPQMAQPPHLIS